MEVVAEVKTLLTHRKCSNCGEGLMERVGDTVYPTSPPIYPHKCNNCGSESGYTVEYPYIRYVPIEPYREPVGNEIV